MDATDKQARAPRSRGRSVVVLYNTIRPHSAIGNQPPAVYARLSAPEMQRAGTLELFGGSAPHPVAPPSQTGSNAEQTLLIPG